MNEVTTVAAAYVMAGFANDATHVSSSGTPLAQTGIANAFGNAVNLADSTTGAALTTTPAGNGAVPQSEINMLAACVGLTSGNSCSSLFETATGDGTPNGAQPTDTATAAINIAHHPGANVAELYTLSSAASVFTPALAEQPNDFSVAVNFFVPNSNWAVNYERNYLGAHQIAVDASGNVWIPGWSTSTAYGLMKLSSLGAVLSPPNGYMGGGLLNPFGVAIDPSGNVWVTDPVFAANTTVTVSEFSSAGVPLSPSTGFVANNPQLGVSIAIDGEGNAWLPYGSGVAELSSAGQMVVANPRTPGVGGPLGGIAVDANEKIWGAVVGGGGGTATSFFAEFSSSGAAINPPMLGQYSCGALPLGEQLTEGAAIDASGSLWLVDSAGFVKEGVAAIPPCSGTGGGFVYQIEDRGGDIAIDGDGNAWVISGGGGNGTLSEFSNSGAPISPSNGFVGIPYEPITLNGYAVVSFADLAPDSSGNLWVIQQLYTGDYSHQMPYTFYAKEFIGISAPVVTPLSAGVKNHTLGSRP